MTTDKKQLNFKNALPWMVSVFALYAATCLVYQEAFVRDSIAYQLALRLGKPFLGVDPGNWHFSIGSELSILFIGPGSVAGFVLGAFHVRDPKPWYFGALLVLISAVILWIASAVLILTGKALYYFMFAPIVWASLPYSIAGYEFGKAVWGVFSQRRRGGPSVGILILMLSMPQTSRAWENNTSHPVITNRGIDLVGQEQPGKFLELNSFRTNISEGSRLEDLTADYEDPGPGGYDTLIVTKHFHNPGSPRAIKGLTTLSPSFGPFEDALERAAGICADAISLYKLGNKTRAYGALGHAAHLVTQDMTQPAHTHDDPHLPHAFFGDGETIESTFAALNPDSVIPANLVSVTVANSSPLTPQGVRNIGNEVSEFVHRQSRFPGFLSNEGDPETINLPNNIELAPIRVMGITSSNPNLQNDHYEIEGIDNPPVIYFDPAIRGDIISGSKDQDWWEVPANENPPGEHYYYFDRQRHVIADPSTSERLDLFFIKKFVPISVSYTAGLLKAAVKAFDSVRPTIELRNNDAQGSIIQPGGVGGGTIYVKAVDPAGTDPGGNPAYPVPSGIFHLTLTKNGIAIAPPTAIAATGVNPSTMTFTGLKDGDYEFTAFDGLGNESSVLFTVQQPPIITVSAGNIVVTAESGTLKYPISTPEIEGGFVITGEGSPLESVTLQKDGVFQNQLLSPSFTAGQTSYSGLIGAALGGGSYKLSAKNSNPTPTSVEWQVEPVDISPLTAASARSTYDPAAQKFELEFDVNLAAPAGAKTMYSYKTNEPSSTTSAQPLTHYSSSQFADLALSAEALGGRRSFVLVDNNDATTQLDVDFFLVASVSLGTGPWSTRQQSEFFESDVSTSMFLEGAVEQVGHYVDLITGDTEYIDASGVEVVSIGTVTGSFSLTDVQPIGTYSTALVTWNEGEAETSCSLGSGSASVVKNQGIKISSPTLNTFCTFKKFYKYVATLTHASQTSFVRCLQLKADGVTCGMGERYALVVNPRGSSFGVFFSSNSFLGPQGRFFPGQSTLKLRAGLSLAGMTPEVQGKVAVTMVDKMGFEGYDNLIPGPTFNLEGDIEEIGGPFQIKVAYGDSGLTEAQEQRAQAFDLFSDPCARRSLPVAINASSNEAVISATGFGRYLLATSEFENEVSVGGPAFRLTSNAPAPTIGDASSNPNLEQMISVQRAVGSALVGEAYDVGPSGRTFDPPLLIEATYTADEAEAAGAAGNVLLQLKSSDGSQPHPPTSVAVDPTCRKVTARVSELSSIFGIFGNGTSIPVSDLLSPITTLSVDGLTPSSTEYLVVSATSTLSLSASDPSFPGAPVSGVAETLTLLDVPFVDTTSTPGQPYAGPFSLSAGSHTLVYYSRDIDGNVETARVVSIIANAPPTRGVGGLGIGRDAANRLWTVALDGDVMTLARTDDAGVVVSSAPLLEAVSGAQWGVLFDDTGSAYAVGTAEGPSTIAADLAVYKASMNGDEIVSSRIFDSGFGGDDLVFDAAAPGWIVGSVEVSEGVSKSAIWRFNPADMTVALSTVFASGAALGVAVDADGSAWVAGYLTNPAPRSSRVLDLGLWHFASDGQTLLAGPFRREAYAADFSSTFAAEISISSAAVTVTAPRGRPGGGTDLGLVRFDKASGAVLSENAWRPADGTSAYPAALLPDGNGILAAGGLDGGTTRAALWRFGADGGLTSASLAAASGARGAVIRGSELWLAVDDATSPFKVTSESALPGSLVDVLPPRVELVVSAPSFVSGEGAMFAAPASSLTLVSADDKLAFGDGLGAGGSIVYFRADSTGSFSAFSSLFSFEIEGAHAVEFYGVDTADNPGPILSRSITIDRTAPVSELFQNEAEITLDASDPNGAGVARIRYLVDYLDPDVCDNVAEDTAAARGTCENPWYAGPFTLSNGGHVVLFQAFDNVGNAELAQTAFPNVESFDGGVDPGGLGIGRDPFDAFWTVNLEPAAVAFTRSDSSGALISSATLQDAEDGLPWSVFFDTAGRAYAIGMAKGLETQALDLAIYKASPSGDAIESRTLFDAGYANNELVFDAKSPGWIVGAAQTSGPVDFDVEGDRSLSLALWRFEPASGTVELTTSTTRAGFDFGTGLAVDADASLWIVGYSAQPDAPDVGGLDLALWHYGSDGRTVLGGPFLMPGYLSNLDGGITAKVHVTADAVYVAAPRINGAGGFDMAFLKFDKATGQALVEKVWRAEGGSSSYPVAILPEAAGLLIAGGIGDAMTDAGLWRFGYDGGFLSATTADAGGAQGAVFRGSELWLSVDGSTSPYRVMSEAPAAGALVDISTLSAPAGLAVNPSTGPIGIPFTVAGAGFGPYSGSNTRIKFGTLAAPVSVWNDTTIKGTIPGLSTGAYAVTLERQNVSSLTVTDAGIFTVTDLNTAALNISSGPIGTPFIIAGAGFGPYAGVNTRVLIGGATAPLSVWNDTKISGTLPGVSPGETTILIQRATADGGLSMSAGFPFEVTVPSVTAVSPSSAPIGAVYTLTGFSFGPYAGANTRVLIGGATTALSLWSDRTIKGTVPGALSPGVQTVIVERRTADGGLVQSGTAYFQVAGLMVLSLAPSSGPIGIPFTISGAGFGAYDGANTRVRFGVSTAALSLWNDTTIKGTVPALEAGDWSVMVERQQGASVASVSAGTFTVAAPNVEGIAPSSGPIGVPFTITGSQFGVYGGANTRVKFNGVLAPLSLWNDTTITGTVPALSTGIVDVVVERQQGADVASSMVASFTVVEIAPGGLAPESGPIGTVFTITGAGFGPYAGANTRVLIGGATAALSLWNDTTITGTIPNLPAGAQPLWIERSAGTGVQSSATAYFEVTVPAVSSLSPSSAPIGAPFTITGTSFGAYAGTNTRVLFNGVSAALSLWNDTQITGTVPALPAGEVGVIVERLQGGGSVESDSVPFTIVAPSADPVAPVSGPIGTVFTITGSGFGPYAGTNTRVLIGGATAALSLWNDTTIKGAIPALPSGVQPVWLERSAGSGVSSSATSYFTVTTPAVAGMTPSSGPIGAPFTINGTSFGAYAGASTRVKFNGVVAPLSVWNDTQIKGTVPGSLAQGAAEVVVERAAGAGLAVSATQAFFVIVPAISTISPSYGPAGTVVTVTGTGFGPYSGALTKLLVGGSTVPLSVWNDTTIRWTVPAFLGDGEYPVVVERSPAGGTVTSASATFTVGSPFSGGESLAFSATLSLAETPDVNFEGGMSLSSTTGGRIDTPAKAAVDIPANAMEADTEITLKRIESDGRRDDAAGDILKRAAGEPIEFGPEGTRFAAPVTIELPYDPDLAADETKIAIHYYNPLRRAWEELPSVVDRARKVVTAKTDHFSIYQPMGLAPTAAAQDEFYFRDAYAFPNPSRGGAAVTFRIQPGLAETVELRVYDLSGRKIHSSSDFTFRGAIDDGNGKGAQNTYDHAWGVSGVGSGVYNYVIKASQRGHKPITKSGKVAIIR